KINDKHGRSYADESLRSVGNLLKDATRDTDVCSRFSGDEFMILMPNTDRAKANLVANRIKTNLRNMSGLFEPVTASIGVAVVLAAQATEDDILDLANQSMQNAKQQGGNTIEIDAFYGT
ncbi:MAG: GGDEF domain-containing protein, partial [Pseudomonadales bacterium]